MSDAGMLFVLVLWILGMGLSMRTQSTVIDRIDYKLDLLLKHSGLDVNTLVDQEIQRLLREGKKDKAVTYYSELTGTEKKAARQHVDDLEWHLIQQKLQD
jgi:hypothetical protein